VDRRHFLGYLTVAAACGIAPRVAMADGDDLYDVGKFGNARLLHLTDTHAQLAPVYFREPSVNLGVGPMRSSERHLADHDCPAHTPACRRLRRDYLHLGPFGRAGSPRQLLLAGAPRWGDTPHAANAVSASVGRYRRRSTTSAYESAG